MCNKRSRLAWISAPGEAYMLDQTFDHKCSKAICLLVVRRAVILLRYQQAYMIVMSVCVHSMQTTSGSSLAANSPERLRSCLPHHAPYQDRLGIQYRQLRSCAPQFHSSIHQAGCLFFPHGHRLRATASSQRMPPKPPYRRPEARGAKWWCVAQWIQIRSSKCPRYCERSIPIPLGGCTLELTRHPFACIHQE